MSTAAPTSQNRGETASRKRRAHKKSRHGCRNCKLRSIKCDETRPKCMKCISFGVTCNYDPKAPDLHMAFDEKTIIQGAQKAAHPLTQSLVTMTRAPAFPYPAVRSDDTSTFQLDRQSWDRLGRYLQRTIFTTATSRGASILQQAMLSLACAHPFLMHTLQSLTSIHDRHLLASSTSRQSVTEIYHLSQGAILFNKKLSAPISPEDRDAVWATCGLMGIISFCCVDASTPEEAWPLKSSEPFDLDWVGMSEKKAAIFNLTNPIRPDSLFHFLIEGRNDDSAEVASAANGCALDGIPSAFLQLYELNHLSTSDNNPYYAIARVLAPLMVIECNESTIIKFIDFITHIEPDFRDLLVRRDPRALLLLAYWYAKVCQSVWWLERRAIVECQAICIYLERFHAHETKIQELLHFPKLQCGLILV